MQRKGLLTVTLVESKIAIKVINRSGDEVLNVYSM